MMLFFFLFFFYLSYFYHSLSLSLLSEMELIIVLRVNVHGSYKEVVKDFSEFH